MRYRTIQNLAAAAAMAVVAITANAQVVMSLNIAGAGLPSGPTYGTFAVALVNPGAATITITPAAGFETGGKVSDSDNNIWFKPVAGATGYNTIGSVGGSGTFGLNVLGAGAGAYAGYHVFSTSGGYSGSYDSITLNLFNSANTWNSVFDVVTPGTEVSAHFYKTADSGATFGYASAIVPEPGAYALIAGLGLVGFAGLRRWRNRA